MTGLAALLLCGSFAARGDVIISEFMAINDSTIEDQNQVNSDWIELYNSGSTAVNLGGWYLSNTATNLTQWKFPATNIGPGTFMIVFASGKSQKNLGEPLHTSFKLSGSGEYLALVMPDGVTKTTEFAPAYPPQIADISYGCVMTGAVTTLVAPNASARALVPSADLGTNWTQLAFDDSAWTAGTLGVGFDASGNYASAIGLDLGNAMSNLNASAYVRIPFTVTNPATLNLLTLNLRYDDGFVAWLNGTEVLRRNAPAVPAWNSTATAVHGTPPPGMLAEDFEGTAANYTLSQYDAAPAPAVQPPDGSSTGGFLRLLYDGVNSSANTVTFRQTAPGLFQKIVADFDFRISSAINNPADGFSFMLIPTSLYGTNGPGVNPTLQAAESPNYVGVFGVGFRVYPHTSVNNIGVHWNGTRVTDAAIPLSEIDLAAGLFHHARITLQHVEGGALVTVTLTPDINGAPGTPYSPVTDYFVPGLNPFDCRVQFGGRTGGLNLALDLDNCNLQFLPSAGPVAFEPFDLTPFLGQLVPGANLLAIQALNRFATNGNLLIQPELLGGSLVLVQPPTFLYPPTPGAWNDSAGLAASPPSVTFWPPAGVYASNQLAVTLSASSPSATIHYTLNGSVPTTNSPVYTTPIPVTANTVLRAQADVSGFPGAVAAANYILLDSSMTNFTSNLPLVLVDTLGQTIPDGSKIGAYSVFLETNTPAGRTSLTGPADYVGRLGIGLHGSSSLGFPKHPYTIETDDENDNALNFPLLGLPEGSDWVFYPPYSDKTLMNNFLSYELFESMGNYSVRRKYFELFIHSGPGRMTASDYQGVYVLLEHIRIAPNRVNIPELKTTDNTPPAVTGGYIIAKDKLNDTNDLTFNTAYGGTLIIDRPRPDKLTQAQYDYITGFVSDLESSLYSANWRDPALGYAAYLDVDELVDFHWIVEYAKNIDGVRLSNYMTKDRGGRLKMGPIWDWDLAWGNADYLQGGNTNGWYYPQMGDTDDIWLRRLRTDPDFYQKIIDRWGALRLNLFNGTNLLARIDQLTNYLWEAKSREFSTWPRLGTYVWPNPNGAAGGFDINFVSPTTYSGIIAQSKKFVMGRYRWIDQQFLLAPTLSTNGGSLTLTAPLGSIYFTLDGADPRASGGATNASSRLYTGAVPLTSNAAIVARAFYTNAWSPPVKALYVVATPTLRITEIMYHPSAPPTNSPYGEKDFEFVEIQNTGPEVINLAGARLGGGIDFTFAPYEWMEIGIPTTNNFDGIPEATKFTASTLGMAPSPFLDNSGPSGTSLCLLNSTTNTTRNRLTFNQTSTGACDRVTTEFDFRAATTMVGVSNGTPTLQDFDNPGTAYTLTYSGTTAPEVLPADAGSAGSFLRLVPSAGGQLGVAAFDRTTAGAFNSVVATFDFRITPPAGGSPADGFGFALLSTASYGTTGAGPNFAEAPNLTSTIGVGFDDYNNGSTAQEPNNNHISLHWNGAQIGNAVIPSFTMSDGRFHRARIIVWFSGSNAYVTVRLTPNINGTPGPTETVLQNVLITGAAPYSMRAAFGARTGGAWAAHDLDNVDVRFAQNVAAGAGLSLLFLPVSQFGATGAGTTLANFTDWPLVSNTLAMDLTFNPSNLVNDVSFYWNRLLVAGTTLPPEAIDLDGGAFHHASLQLDTVSGGVRANLALTTNSLGVPGTPLTVVSNLFIPGAALGDRRLEFAGRNSGLLARVDLDNVRSSAQTLAPLLLNPGESIVVAENLAAFTSRYGNAIRVAGEYSGTLNNAGERLTLLGPLGEPILDFSYFPDWYPITDGGGFSLVAVDPVNALPANWGLQSNWRPSSELGGSPGGVDAPPPPAVLTVSTSPGSGDLVISWPAGAGAFGLFSAPVLQPSVQWTPVTNAPVLSGDLWMVTVGPPAEGGRFFRLQR